MDIMYDGVFTRESVIEGVNFAAQTLTTVGYGNWETPAVPHDVPDRPARILTMRLWSIGFMILGASLYAIFLGIVVSIYIPPSRA